MSHHHSILVVEPSPELQLLLTYTLRLEHYNVTKASNADEAERFLSYTPTDLLIVEPIFEGVEWLIKSIYRLPTLVLSSAHNGEAMAKQVGAMFMSKPYSLQEFLAVVKLLLAGNEEIPTRLKEVVPLLKESKRK